MSEPFKIRVGSKSNKGTLKSENDDRILIGMDPAANDWLFSPDPVQVGEFGTVLLLADGLGDNENGGTAANAICKTIKKLFDETLELPPSDDEKLRLLVKFFQIAQKQLQSLGIENPVYKNIGASATLVLLLENKAFIVWLGNCRAYRYNSKGVNNTFFTDLPNLELLTVDHIFETEKELFDEYRSEKYFYPTGISKYFCGKLISHEISATIVSLKKMDRILICTEGLFSVLSDKDIQEILSSSEDPEISADVLISRAFNNGTEKNISVILSDVLAVEFGIPEIKNTESQLIDKARLLYGAPVATEVLPESPKESIATPPAKEKAISPDEDLVPVKLRTVMPEPDPVSDMEEEIPEKDDLSENVIPAAVQIAIEWPAESEAEAINPIVEEEVDDEEEEETEEDIEEEMDEEFDEETEDPEFLVTDKSDLFVAPLIPEAPASQIQGEMAERLARLKIKMTVYPDPEDKAQEKTENSTGKGSDIVQKEHDANASFISIDLNEEIEANEEIEEYEQPSGPQEDDIFQNIIVSENEVVEEDNEKSDADQEEPIEIPEPFESKILPLSEAFVIDLEVENEKVTNENESQDEEEDEDEIQEEAEEDFIDEPYADIIEKEEIYETNEDAEPEIEPEIVALSQEKPERQPVSEKVAPEVIQAPASVPKPIAHLIGTDKEDNKPGSSEKKSKLWPYFLVLGLLILIPVWICRDNSELSSDNNINGASTAISIGNENTQNQSVEEIPIETEPESDTADNEEEEEEIINPPAEVVPDPETEKPKEKKKEEIKPKSDSRQPKYDADVEKNKHQLLGEVQALLQQKNQLCKQINTYGRNAPENKSESIKQVQNKCDQLGQKFSSIYDQKSGFFKTVRYDFMKGTIKSIRVSMEQIDLQFKTIREE